MPMPADGVNRPDLKMIEIEIVFKISEDALDTPAQGILLDNSLLGKGQMVGDEDMKRFLV